MCESTSIGALTLGTEADMSASWVSTTESSSEEDESVSSSRLTARLQAAPVPKDMPQKSKSTRAWKIFLSHHRGTGTDMFSFESNFLFTQI